MMSFSEVALSVALIADLAVLGSGRLRWCIALTAVQGIATGSLLILTGGGWPHIRLVGLFLAICFLKGFVFPRLLLRSARAANVRHEVAPLIGYASSTALGVLVLLTAFWFAARLELPPWHRQVSDLVLPTAFASSITGLLLIVSRRSALMQVIGYIVLENGVFTFGLALAQDEPFLIEMGILLDVFVAVLVMGVAIFHISREFDHIDVERLSTLKD